MINFSCETYGEKFCFRLDRILKDLYKKYPVLVEEQRRCSHAMKNIVKTEGTTDIDFIEYQVSDCFDYWAIFLQFYWLQGRRLALNEFFRGDNTITDFETLDDKLDDYCKAPFVQYLKNRAFKSFTICWETVRPESRPYLRNYNLLGQQRYELLRNPIILDGYDLEVAWLYEVGHRPENSLGDKVHERFGNPNLPQTRWDFFSEWEQWKAAAPEVFTIQPSESTVTMKLKQAVGHNIHTARLNQGISVKAFAEAADLTVEHLGHIERGCSNINLKTLKKIAVALDVPTYQLFKQEQENQFEMLDCFVTTTIKSIDVFNLTPAPRFYNLLNSEMFEKVTLNDFAVEH